MRWNADRALGVIGLSLRLTFAGALVPGVLGLYYAAVSAAFQENSHHDRVVGWELIGVWAALSATACALLHLPRLRDSIDDVWYAATYVTCVVVGWTVFWAFMIVQTIENWHRGTASTTAVVSSCQSQERNSNTSGYVCNYTWTWKGVTRETSVSDLTNNVPNGTHVTVSVNPANGGLVVHNMSELVGLYLFVGFSAIVAIGCLVLGGRGLARADWNLRLWLRVIGVLPWRVNSSAATRR